MPERRGEEDGPEVGAVNLYRVLVRFPGQRHRVALTVRGRDEWEAERSALSHLETYRLHGDGEERLLLEAKGV